MKVKKNIKFTNKKTIWRLLPITGSKLVIEERNSEKEVFFNCINYSNGEEYFRSFQLEEKFWIGIETIYKDVIYFHKFNRPEMPGHKEIIAVNLFDQKTLWRNEEYIFHFVHDDKVYSYKNKFDGRIYYTLDYLTGEFLEELGPAYELVNDLREQQYENDIALQGFHFPNIFDPSVYQGTVERFFIDLMSKQKIVGNIEHIYFNNNILYNYHIETKPKVYRNIFQVFDIEKKKVIFEEVLDDNISALIPDCFFIKNESLFLLKNKQELLVCNLI